jgi:hypothetical protein
MIHWALATTGNHVLRVKVNNCARGSACWLQKVIAHARVRVESGAKRLDVLISMENRRIVLSLACFVFLAALSVCASNQEPAEGINAEGSPEVTNAEESPSVPPKWGYYDGDPVTKWNPDGRTMTLLTELRYTDPHGVEWVAPIGSVVDGASIPRYLWSIMGGPFEGQYRNASVLHDVAYGQKKRPWQDCDRMFYYAMRCSGVNAVEAKTMFYALYKFGHHWKFPIKRGKPVKHEGQMVARAVPRAEPIFPRAVPVNPAEINQAREWINDADPSLEQIEQRANTETR